MRLLTLFVGLCVTIEDIGWDVPHLIAWAKIATDNWSEMKQAYSRHVKGYQSHGMLQNASGLGLRGVIWTSWKRRTSHTSFVKACLREFAQRCSYLKVMAFRVLHISLTINCLTSRFWMRDVQYAGHVRLRLVGTRIWSVVPPCLVDSDWTGSSSLTDFILTALFLTPTFSFSYYFLSWEELFWPSVACPGLLCSKHIRPHLVIEMLPAV